MKIRHILKRGRPMFEVEFGRVGGQRRRVLVKTEAEAKRLLKDVERERDQIGNQWTQLPATKRVEVLRVLAEMKTEGVTIEQVWSAYRNGRTDKVVSSIPIRDAIKNWQAAKEASNKRPRYVQSFVETLNQFSNGRDMMAVSEFRRHHIEDYMKQLADAKLSTWTRAIVQRRIDVFFRFALTRDWCAQNPCAKLDRIHVEWTPRKILKPDIARELLETTARKAPDLLWNVVLAMFCGIRQEELDRLTPDKVDLMNRLVTIDATVAKKRRRRVVPIPESAIKWLELHPGLGWSTSFRRRWQRDVRTAMGWQKWPQNFLRHTAASYLMAREKDAGKVATILGNSPVILMEHYHELVPGTDSEVFWKIEPPEGLVIGAAHHKRKRKSTERVLSVRRCGHEVA